MIGFSAFSVVLFPVRLSMQSFFHLILCFNKTIAIKELLCVAINIISMSKNARKQDE